MWPFKSKTQKQNELADFIDKVADVIEQNGHMTGRTWRNWNEPYTTGPVCLIGAFGVASGHSRDGIQAAKFVRSSKAAEVVANALSSTFYGALDTRLWHWNDNRPSYRSSINQKAVVKKLREIAQAQRPKRDDPPAANEFAVQTQNDFELAGGSTE